MNPRLTVIHLARKPLIGTVALNALKHGTGGLNIDACRIGYANDADMADATPQGVCTSHDKTSIGAKPNIGQSKSREVFARPEQKGRWPANLILQHEPGCVQAGTKKVRTATAVKQNRDADAADATLYEGGWRKLTVDAGYADPDGTETVADWQCVEGCPVVRLDEQSSDLHSAGSERHGQRDTTGESKGMFPAHGKGGHRFGDTGGASRFFKQVRGDE